MTDEFMTKYYKNNDYFEYTNPNPKSKKQKTIVWRGLDCVVRALANSTNNDWIKCYDFLSAKARRDFSVMNDGNYFKKWIVENGGKWIGIKNKKGEKRMTAYDFVLNHKNGRYILSTNGHYCAVVNGKILDTWNTSNSAIYGYFDMENFSIY